jgi:hypothetical protein
MVNYAGGTLSVAYVWSYRSSSRAIAGAPGYGFCQNGSRGLTTTTDP